jgi:hypothetical protein
VKTLVVTALALIGGFFAGIVLSEVIGIAGFLLFDSVVGFKFLPLVSALAGAFAAVAGNRRARRSRPVPPTPQR